MFKYKKQREEVERKLNLITLHLENLSQDERIDKNGVVYESLVAQKVILKEILRHFEQIES